MMVIFLGGLSPCLWAGDAMVAKIGEDFWQWFPVIHGADALFGDGAIFYDNGNPRLMYSPTFVAGNEDLVRSLRTFRGRCYCVCDRKF